MCACMWFQTTGDVKRYKTGDDDNFSQVSSTEMYVDDWGRNEEEEWRVGGRSWAYFVHIAAYRECI